MEEVINMNHIKCITHFSVFQDYKEITVENLPDDDLVADRIFFSPDYVVQVKADNYNQNTLVTFNPLEDSPFLYLELAKINSDDDLMKFVKIYGLPFQSQESYINDDVKIIEMDTITFFKKLSLYKDLLYLWFDLQNHIGTTPFVPSPHFNSLIGNTSNREKSIGAIISNVLNDMKTWKESFEQLDTTDDGTIIHCVRFNNLLETSYFQLTRAILRKSTLRRCNECNEVFEVTHELQKFCPPKMGRKRSTCENTHKVRKSRQKQRLKENKE